MENNNLKNEQQCAIHDVMHSALNWWDTLRNTRLCNGTKDKGYYADKYFGFNMRMYKHLSKDEICMIFSKEHCA